MKQVLFIISVFAISVTGFSQTPFESFSERANEKTLKGVLTREALENDTSFHWYAENQKGFNPNKDAVAGLQNNKDSIHLVAFMGTWCEDSRFIIPKLYSLMNTAGFPESKLTLIGVDRKKNTWSDLAGAFAITNVPTIIVMKNGKEVGRVVEYGKFGLFDMDLGSILKSLNN